MFKLYSLYLSANSLPSSFYFKLPAFLDIILCQQFMFILDD